MPSKTSEQEQADLFANYFHQKIVNIREALSEYDEHLPSGECNHHLSAFHSVTGNDVRKVIKTLATKSCELDEIPTKILKSCLVECLGIVTKIVNALLDRGRFVSTRKIAIVRPLLKKPGLELAESNYCPVSNLNFLLKVLETVALQQFIEHCRTFNLLRTINPPIANTTHARRRSSRLLMTSFGIWKTKK